MNTRDKITTPEAAIARYPEYAVVLASFDVLTASRIASLRAMAAPKRPLIAVISELPNTLLSLQARAELAASLAIIDCVITAADPSGLLARATVIFDDREADAARTKALIDHVQRRNRA